MGGAFPYPVNEGAEISDPNRRRVYQKATPKAYICAKSPIVRALFGQCNHLAEKGNTGHNISCSTLVLRFATD